MSTNRRDVVKLTGATVTALAVGAVESHAKVSAEDITKVKLPLPNRKVGRAAELEIGQTKSFSYPDADSPCLLIKLKNRVVGGVGPEGNIVAYSQFCSHQGCPVSFEAKTMRLKCHCHFTLFDPEKNGQVICGQATVSLPRVELTYEEDSDEITAEGIDGLIYGRQANLLI